MTKISNDVMGYKVVANNEVKMFNNVDDVVDYVVMMFKKHPNNAVYVNGFRLTLERTKDYKWSVILRDENMEMIAGFVLGKIKRGLRNALAHVLGYIEVNEENEVVEENEYDVIENLVEVFNEKIENIIDGIWNETCENAVFNAEICNDTENEYVCATMD